MSEASNFILIKKLTVGQNDIIGRLGNLHIYKIQNNSISLMSLVTMAVANDLQSVN